MVFLKTYQLYITLGLAALVLIQFIIVVSLSSRLTRISRTLRSLFSGPEGADLEAILRRCQNQSQTALERSDELDARLTEVIDTVEGCIQHCGLVRYDGFGDVSGQQSFSLALLDADRNGAVLTGLFSRSDSRCYGKAVVAGEAEQELSIEEQKALDVALSDAMSAPMEVENTRSKRRLLRN